MRDSRDFPLLITCWNLDKQEEVHYHTHMKSASNVIIFIGNRWWKDDKETPKNKLLRKL